MLWLASGAEECPDGECAVNLLQRAAKQVTFDDALDGEVSSSADALNGTTCRNFILTGKVQMVHYRNWVVGKAKAQGVKGWVANGGDKTYDGNRGRVQTETAISDKGRLVGGTTESFAALRRDGSVVTWGGHPGPELKNIFSIWDDGTVIVWSCGEEGRVGLEHPALDVRIYKFALAKPALVKHLSATIEGKRVGTTQPKRSDKLVPTRLAQLAAACWDTWKDRLERFRPFCETSAAVARLTRMSRLARSTTQAAFTAGLSTRSTASVAPGPWSIAKASAEAHRALLSQR
ncbi:hypothetical protein AK812_SmicGene31643 [Symbiodinium microadriaticum]|uniref:acylphosphatase n=1 Tax=Symbiodinium microadriaticum TaxID=2951 RepID=A0A1Q9CW48_SYMMI|nr:hypothetical protein AK812_SmicGene31643 [Symbiodinium microadriaticum]